MIAPRHEKFLESRNQLGCLLIKNEKSYTSTESHQASAVLPKALCLLDRRLPYLPEFDLHVDETNPTWLD